MAKLMTGKVRLSYPHLAEPRANSEGEKPKYSATLLIPKDDKATLGKIKDAIKEAADEFREKNGAASLPAKPKTTLHDGDGEREDGSEFGAECKGCYVITVSSQNAPLLIDRSKNEVDEVEEVFYPGCYVRAQLNFKGYNFNGKKGITAYLNAVQWLADGERLGEARVSADDFDDLEDDFDDDDEFLA